MIDPLQSQRLAGDVQDMGQLRRAARDNTPDALRAATKQFEALFMNMLMKSMREATPQDGMFDNDQTRMYTSMLDQQLAQTMASRGVGLADVLYRQLSANLGAVPGTEAMNLPLPARMPFQAPRAPDIPLPAGGARTVRAGRSRCCGLGPGLGQ